MENRPVEVLVVDNDLLERIKITYQLEDAGFVVSQASSFKEAIEFLTGNTTIAVMFTDHGKAGGVNGAQLAASVSERWPSVSIIVTSGNPDADVVALPQGARFIPKPYTAGTVISWVREMTLN